MLTVICVFHFNHQILYGFQLLLARLIVLTLCVWIVFLIILGRFLLCLLTLASHLQTRGWRISATWAIWVNVSMVIDLSLLQLGQINWRKWRYHVLLAIALLDQLVISLSQLAYLELRSILCRGQQIRLVVRVWLQMFYFLFAVKHLPALDAEHFSIWFGLYHVQSIDECGPLHWMSSNHLFYRCLFFWKLALLDFLIRLFWCDYLDICLRVIWSFH
jgi:hypothetical protein